MTRDLGPDVLGRLRENPSIDVCRFHSLVKTRADTRVGYVGKVGGLAARLCL